LTKHSMVKTTPGNATKQRLRSLVALYLPPVLPFVICLVAWWGISLFDIPKYIFPTPGQVLEELTNSKWRWFPQIWTTTQEVMGGFVLAVIVGVLLGLVVSWNETLSRTLMPILLFFNGMPKVAAAPLILVWFGFGVLPNIVMSFVISFFPVLLNTARGVSEVPYEMTELALTFNTPKWKRFAMIRVPYALPYIMTGVKLASIMAVTGAIVGEFIASEKGLAALILQAQSYLEMGAMVGALLWISVMAMILFGLINLAERLLMPWAKIRETD